jgi:hypothetical protein
MAGNDTAELWIDAVPRVFGLEALLDRLTGSGELAPYLLVSLGAGLDAGSSVYLTMRGGEPAPLLQNPFWVILPAILLFAVWSIRKFREWYRAIPDHVDLAARTGPDYGPESFESLVSRGFRLGLYGLAVGLYATALLLRGSVPAILETLGPVVGALKFVVVGPVVYIPVGVEFATLFVGIHIRLPRLIRRSNLSMDFTDPTDFGGMYRFGVLIKYSYYSFAVVLLLFLFWTYAPVIFPGAVGADYPPPGLETTVQFAGMWVLGTGLLAHSVAVFHRHMADAKEDKLREVTERIRELGDDGETIPDTQPAAEDAARIRLEYENLRRVRQIREYPIDLVMISQLVFSILLPLVVERVFTSLV